MLIALVSLPGITPAQPYYFRHYQVEEGLSNNTIFCSAQDKTGFLWFGTKDGLNRFDGYHFKRFNLANPFTEHTIAYNPISALFIGQDGKMYLGADGGLYLYHADEERLSPLLDSIRYVNSILGDAHHNLWFTAAGAIYRFNTVNKQLKRFFPVSHAYANSLTVDQEGHIWCSNSEGFIEQYDEAGDHFIAYDVFNHSPPAATRSIQRILAGSNNKIYIGTSAQGIKEFDLPSKTYKDLLIYNNDKTNLYIRDILQASPQEYWFATESGIYIWNTATRTFVHLQKKFLDPYSLSDNAIYTLCKDREGGIWAGSYFGGVNYLSVANDYFQKYFSDNGPANISGNAVREICEDKKGNLWIGTEDAGLNKLNPQTGMIRQFKPTGTKDGIAYSNIHGLYVDNDRLWIGTFEHGIDIMDLHSEKIIRHYAAGPKATDIKSDFAFCFMKSTKQIMYVGTTHGLFAFDSTSETFYRPAECSQVYDIKSIIEDRKGIVWAAAAGHGVFWFNPATHRKGQLQAIAGNRNSLPDNNINALFEDSFGNIWFATEGNGLCKLDIERKTFTRYSTQDGLPSKFIFKVIEDNNQHIWITSSRGLARLDPVSGEINVYTKANGLLTDQFNYHSGYKDKSGRLYFGSVKGMISFQPQFITSGSSKLQVYLTSIQVQNKEIPVGPNGILRQSLLTTDKIDLAYYQTSVSFDFTALSYAAPGMVQYAYMLQGLDKDWTYLNTNRKVYFTNLSPGTYTFRVKATLNHAWNAPETRLTIQIHPPIWATPYAYVFYGLILVCLSWYLIVTYHNRQKVKREKEMYESKMAFFTNVSHEIRTPLTLIKGPLENMLDRLPQIEDEETREDLVTMDRNTTRLTELVTQILDFRQTEQKGFSLEFSTVNLSRLLQEMFTNFKPLVKKKHLSYTLSVPENTIEIQADEDALRKIISNLLSNAIKYADKIVTLRLFRDDALAGKLVLEIENDGYPIPVEIREKIFEPFYRVKETSRQKGTGIGLTLARSLTELHGGRLYLKDHKGSTNIFVLEIPLHSSKRNHTK
jgi:signal transduction histidine kinase/ligand-binding sensor domain-containing protein